MNASEQITNWINELADWRGQLLAHLRRLIPEADPAIVEEWNACRNAPSCSKEKFGALKHEIRFRPALR